MLPNIVEIPGAPYMGEKMDGESFEMALLRRVASFRNTFTCRVSTELSLKYNSTLKSGKVLPR